MRKTQHETFAFFLLAVSLVMQGSFYTYGYCFTGFFVAMMLAFVWGKRKVLQVPTGLLAWIMGGLGVLSIIQIFFALDRGMAFYGALRIAVLCLWVCFCLQFTPEQRNVFLQKIPGLSIIMLMICICVLPFPELRDMLFQAQRLGGFFQYANTCALFLLITMVILTQQLEEEGAKATLLQWGMLFMVLVGIGLTGSRIAMVLAALLLIGSALQNRKLRAPMCIIFLAIGILGTVYVVVTGNLQNFGRITTIFSKQSTMWGRLLYIQDALRLIQRYPFGLGFMGYHQIQTTMQTGVYSTVYVHNDWLQIFVDEGWLTGLCCSVVVGWNLFLGKISRLQRKIALLIIGYSFVDFHLQFFFICMILLMCFDYEGLAAIGKRKKNQTEKHNVQIGKRREKRWEQQVECVLLACVLLYFGIAQFLQVEGRANLAYDMYAGDTLALEHMMNQETERETAVSLADQRLQRNEYCADAWNILAYDAYLDGDYQRAIAYMREVIIHDRYRQEAYETMEEWIAQAMQLACSKQDLALQGQCEQAEEELSNLLQSVKQETGALAWKLRDRPFFAK